MILLKIRWCLIIHNSKKLKFANTDEFKRLRWMALTKYVVNVSQGCQQLGVAATTGNHAWSRGHGRPTGRTRKKKALGRIGLGNCWCIWDGLAMGGANCLAWWSPGVRGSRVKLLGNAKGCLHLLRGKNSHPLSLYFCSFLFFFNNRILTNHFP